MKVIGICGLPGSGKSLIHEIAKDYNVIIYNMGDVIREEALKRDMNTGDIAIQLRKEEGDNVVAKLTVERIKKNEYKNRLFIIEGIRSLFEVDFIKENFEDFKLLSIFASPKTRFMRLKMRNREDDSNSLDEFKKRDERELKFGIANVIVYSDYLIVNEYDFEDYKKKLREFFKSIHVS
ncbi:MAG: AAA family ATPase [Methanobrevibacter sp.]|jgi:dephospho-CoA kinase|nr:AAA family ATPase [Candidatus Methanovirga basalitermitum]